MKTVTWLFYFRLGEFAGFLEQIEDLQKKLQKEDLTSEEYKDLQAQFQVLNYLLLYFITTYLDLLTTKLP